MFSPRITTKNDPDPDPDLNSCPVLRRIKTLGRQDVKTSRHKDVKTLGWTNDVVL